ncbi:MAG: sigma-70 family RNA polymerase sigma factor [Planctomycetes bacterium]|nr:sigma-70 family RNA polymerase sigma factor [Planctomycetota bacterium]
MGSCAFSKLSGVSPIVDFTPDKDVWFVQRLADAQRGLYAYILQLLPNRADADDVLQATNLVMWSKRSQFVAGSDFAAWAARIAYYEVLTHRKRKGRDRLRFDDSLVEQLSQEAAAESGQIDAVLQTLRLCMEKLNQPDRDLLQMQYADDLRPRQIAERLGRSPGAISVAMHRIRMSLLKCIDEHDRSVREDDR